MWQGEASTVCYSARSVLVALPDLRCLISGQLPVFRSAPFQFLSSSVLSPTVVDTSGEGPSWGGGGGCCGDYAQ